MKKQEIEITEDTKEDEANSDSASELAKTEGSPK
jgi:hypothetical protein